MAPSVPVVGLDLGHAHFRAGVGYADGGRVHILGVASVPAAGVERGAIVDEAQLAHATERVLRDARRLAGAAGNLPVVVGVGGALWKNWVEAGGPEADLERARYFSRLLRADVEAVVPTAEAAARAVLFPAERSARAAVLDIGEASTDVVVFDDREPVLCGVVPVAGRHVTNDIACGLQVSREEAERLKRRYGAAVRELAPPVCFGGGKGGSGPELFEIVEARVAELLELAAEQLSSALGGVLPERVILTGGSALLAGLQQAAQRMLGVPTRIGVAQGTVGPADVVTSPACAGVIGLLYEVAAAAPAANGAARKGVFDSVRQWLKEFL